MLNDFTYACCKKSGMPSYTHWATSSGVASISPRNHSTLQKMLPYDELFIRNSSRGEGEAPAEWRWERG